MAVKITSKDISASLRDRVREAAANARPLGIVGGGSKGFYGNPGVGEKLEVAGHKGIVDYDPAELVITLRGGCRIADVEKLLAEQGQMLGFEPPHFGKQATIGGAVASGLAGPRRAYAGAIRDFILGVKLLDGRGDILNFGGRVIKNVAGFDLSRLMVGAMGTLGILLEVSLRVIPRPETESTLVFEHESVDDHIQWVNDLCGQPLPLSASLWHDSRSYVRLSGSERGVASAEAELGGEKGEDIWSDVKEHKHAFFKGRGRLLRIALPPTTRFRLQQPQLVEWGGAQRWLHDDDSLAMLRDRLANYPGGVSLFAGAEQGEQAFQPLDDTLLGLHRNLKARFDPAGIFNRGRLYPGL